MFDFEWFHSGGLERLIQTSLNRCAHKKFPNADPAKAEFVEYRTHLETRTILYMKDGLTYEMRDIVDAGSSHTLAFECVPVDDAYKVGAIVLVVPFEDIARVEVFAVHPDDKPQENVRIGGFRSASDPGRD